MKNSILNKIRKLKNEKYKKTIIGSSFNTFNYTLNLLTSECSKNLKMMNLLTAWRKKHSEWFPSQFEVTLDRTILWFKKKVIDADDRLLFMIEINNEYIGHVGLFRFDFDKNTCEIDNIVRGKDGFPGIMGDAIIKMMDWGEKELKLSGYTLQTTSDNIRAIRLYEKLGFKENKRVPLICIQNENQLDWIPAPNDYLGEIKRYDVFMIFNK